MVLNKNILEGKLGHPVKLQNHICSHGMFLLQAQSHRAGFCVHQVTEHLSSQDTSRSIMVGSGHQFELAQIEERQAQPNTPKLSYLLHLKL